MDLTPLFRILTSALVLAGLSLVCLAQAPSRYDPAPPSEHVNKKDGFIDSTLRRINPADTDYGKCLDEGRRLFLDETVENGYFWSNVVALCLIGCMLIMIAYQHQVQTNRDMSAAEMVAQDKSLQERLIAQVDEVTKKNHDLMAALTELRESPVHTDVPPNDSAERMTLAPRPRATRTQSVATSAAVAVAKPVTERVPTAAVPETVPQMTLFRSDTDLIMKVNALEQQLVRSEEQQKLLRRQLNESQRKLQAEQEKNRRLKGE